MGLTQCRRCGGQISTNSTSCPWCGHATTFNLLGPMLIVVMLGVGVSFGLGFLRWQWLEQALGMDRGFVDEVVTAHPPPKATTGNADQSWRLPPAPRARGKRTVTLSRPQADAEAQPAAASGRVAEVMRAAVPTAGGTACADSAAVGRLVARYSDWPTSDLALIACGRVRSGFSGDEVLAALGKPLQVSRAGPGQEQWRYAAVAVIVEQGRVISVGQ